MKDQQLIDHIVALAQLLRPADVNSRISEWTRGSYPRQSFATGRPTGSRPAPTLDNDDRTFARLHHDYRTAIRAAIAALEKAQRIEQIVVPPTPTDDRYRPWREDAARRARGGQGIDCRDCGRPVACTTDDPQRDGRCHTCAVRHYRTT